MKYIILFSLLLFPFSLKAQLPRDIPAIETIISGHKSIWNRLNDRKNNEGVNYTLSTRVKDIAVQYHQVREDLSKRIEYSYNMLVFTKDVVEISKLLVDNTKLIGEYASFVASNLNKMPDLYNFFMKYYGGIELEIKNLKNIVTASVLIRSNYEERFSAIRNIKNSLLNLKWMVERVLWLSKGVVQLDYSNTNWLDLLKDKGIQNFSKKLATEVINEYSK
ncbi:hypothetical protein KSZ35_25030 [Bacteroides xylanisolvens]|jgi:hypothetical protein|uniref:DUF4141 domain-containing protein n=3 Tax=Bacteroidales TaxID=171549 RepID=A0ABY5TIA7_9BACE|nr:MULTISPECIES: hypothetical protein [Bacteroides]MBV4223925.1 hypothetical protein [Bacteroides xylanisolvens]MCS2772958.1 hypothetical protein [Bacteroides thetaiotaomicron]MCS3332292.1 hypothetical protein [Bacteroides thetaiotaomicron]MDC1987105.1 hypothetical protein [Bacteroides uniformis]MDC1990737.1 hypothetical protein [Bacteroides uniformis]